jgi:hypothetical protein
VKVGDLVRPIDPSTHSCPARSAIQTTLVERDWKGIIIGWSGVEPVVFWNERFPAEVEYKEQLEVIDESR